MNLSTVIGLIGGIASILIAFILEGGNPAKLLLPSPIIIIFGGTFSTLFLSFDMGDVLGIGKLFGKAIKMPATKGKELALKFVSFAEKSRRDGILSLEDDMTSLSDSDDPLLKKGLRYVIDGMDLDALTGLLENDVSVWEKHQKHGVEVFEAAGGFAPTMGIIGTVLGLIIVLANLSEPEKLGESISVAFIATLLGIGLANLIFLPLANKLKVVLGKEKLAKEMIIVGILAIQQGESPNIVRDKLAAFLEEHERHEVESMNESS